MRGRRLAGALCAIHLISGQAAAGDCRPSGEALLFAACEGEATVRLILSPEEIGALDDPPANSLTVTGAYTATDARAGGAPKPVGLFIHEGRTISLELGRMDGLLIVERDGTPRIALLADLTLDGRRHDLADLAGRREFAAAMEGRSAMQSHLLIRDGSIDARPVEGAPRARRRLLFQRADGAIGVWDSGSRAMTLHEAAAALMEAHQPAMALNLDMGSYNYCLRVDAEGRAVNCGVRGREGAEQLSNLLRLTLRPGADGG